MARPRIYVDRHGRPVKEPTGVHYNKGRHRFYVIQADGNRREFRTWDDARAAFLTAQANAMPPEELARIAAIAQYRRDLAYQRLLNDPKYAEVMNRPIIPSSNPPLGGSFAETAVSAANVANTLADLVGVPRIKLEADQAAPAGGPQLLDVISAFERHKKSEKGQHTQHHREVARRWGRFVKVVGNLFVAQLQPQHFREFHSWVLREAPKRQSAKWHNDAVKTVKSVLKYVRRKYPEWPWPTGILDWANSYDAKPYRPRAANREPMSVTTFKDLISQCQAWARTDVDQYDPGTQRGRGQRTQALRKKRDGVQFEAILRLGVNCGFDPVDIERVTWSDLRLGVRVPHLRFARRKVEVSVGQAVERITPLLPSTVDVLERLQSFDNRHSGPVFLTARRGPYRSDRLGRTFTRLRHDSGIDDRATFKNTRNVGPTLARRAKLSSDEREAFLGHVVNGAPRFYEGDVDETYLISLVNLIGNAYFDGEQVKQAES